MITPPKQLVSFAKRLVRHAERTVYATGSSVRCPYCHWEGWRFLTTGDDWRPNRLCPGCGSLERYRMLALLLDRKLAGRTDVTLLEIAPKACIPLLCNRRGWTYVSSDLDSPRAMVHADLRAMPMPDGSYDAIACFHVMEHILDDVPAYREIARLLKPEGLGVICVPLGDGPTQEGAPPSEYTRLYGQKDHVRLYGMDIVERMTSAGLEVEVIDTLEYFSAAELTRHALRGDDRILFVVRKAAR